MLTRGLIRKAIAAVLLIGSVSAVSASPMPHLVQLSIEGVPFQKDMSVYKDHTAWYSDWGLGAEAAIRYVSPIGLIVGVRGGVLNTPYLGKDMVHYPVEATLGYRIPTEHFSFGIEGLVGYDFMDYDGKNSRSLIAGGRLYAEMPITDTGFSVTLGGEVVWSERSPVLGTEELAYRVSIPVTVGFTYSIPLDKEPAAPKADNSAPVLPIAPGGSPFIGTVNITNEAPGFVLSLPDGTMLSGDVDEETVEEVLTEEPVVEEEPETAAADNDNPLPDYIEAFFSLPAGVAIPDDVMDAMTENAEGFRYSWSFRRAEGDPEGSVREAWVSAVDPETGAELRRGITADEIARLSSAAL